MSMSEIFDDQELNEIQKQLKLPMDDQRMNKVPQTVSDTVKWFVRHRLATYEQIVVADQIVIADYMDCSANELEQIARDDLQMTKTSFIKRFRRAIQELQNNPSVIPPITGGGGGFGVPIVLTQEQNEFRLKLDGKLQNASENVIKIRDSTSIIANTTIKVQQAIDDKYNKMIHHLNKRKETLINEEIESTTRFKKQLLDNQL
eukprot:505185_1